MFEPKHLTTDQIRELYRQILVQSEEAELVAHANYIRAQAARVAAERELERLIPLKCGEAGARHYGAWRNAPTPAPFAPPVSHEG